MRSNDRTSYWIVERNEWMSRSCLLESDDVRVPERSVIYNFSSHILVYLQTVHNKTVINQEDLPSSTPGNQPEVNSKKWMRWRCMQIDETLKPRSMYFTAISSLVSLWRISLATPKFPTPRSFTTSYFSILWVSLYPNTYNSMKGVLKIL